MNLLAKILFSKLRVDIFRLLFSALSSDITMRQIERRLGVPLQDLQAELKKLVDQDLVTKRREGNRTCYRVNTRHPLYPEIRNLALKTIRAAGELKKRRQN